MLYSQIKCFLEVAQRLSFTNAAEHLYITQQAVTKQISALEANLGVKLFVRSTRSVNLTPAGKQLRDDFSKINRLISESVEKARKIEQGNSTVVTIGFFSFFSKKMIISPLLSSLTESYLGIYFDVKLYDFSDLRNKLLDGELDLCLTTSTDWKSWPSVDTFTLRRKNFEIVYSEKHPLAKLDKFSLDDLRYHTQLVLPHESVIDDYTPWDKQISCKNRQLCSDIGTLLVRVEAGHGFAILTRVFEGAGSPTLLYKTVPFPEASADIICSCRKDMQNPLIHEIIRTVKKYFKENSWPDFI